MAAKSILFGGIAAILASPSLVPAASFYWDTTNATGLTSGTATWDAGTSSAWATSSSPGTAAPGLWTNGNDAFFQTGGTNSVTIAAGGVSVNSITQTTNSTVTTIAGGTLTITGTAGIVNSGNSALTINSNVTLSAASPMTFTINAGNSISIGGAIGEGAGAATIFKTGNGVLTLTGTNSYSGGTTLSAGTLQAQDSGANNYVKALGTGPVTLNAGTLNLRANGFAGSQTIITGDGTTGNDVTVGGDATISVDRLTGGTFQFNTFQFNKLSIGANTLTVSNPSGGASSYSLQFAGAATLTGNATFNLGNTADNLTFSGAIGDGGHGYGITKLGGAAATLYLTAANTYTGATVINGATVQVSGANGSISTSSGISISGRGSKLLVDYTGVAAGSVDRLSDTNTKGVMLDQGGELSFTGNSTASTNTTETMGQLALNSAYGVVTLTKTNSGLVTITAGSFSRGSNGATGLIRGTALGTVGSATTATKLVLTDASGVTLVGTTTATNLGTADTTKNLKIVPYLVGDTTGNGATFLTYDSTLGFRALSTANEFNPYAIAAAGDNVLVSAAVSSAGTKTINSLLINATGANLTSSAGNTLTINSGAILFSPSASGNTATISGFDSITLGNGTWNEGVISVGASDAGNTGATNYGALTISSAIQGGSAGLTKAGKGALTLSAANTFTGATLVNSGMLSVGNNLALQNSAINTSGFGQMALTVTTPTFGGLIGSTALASVLTSGYTGSITSLTLNPGAGVMNTYSGAIADGATGMTLTKSGAGTQTLSGSSSYTGGTTLSAGSLQVGNSAALGTGTLTFTSGTFSSSDTTGYTLANALAINGDVSLGDAVNTGALAFSGNVNLSSGTRTLSVNSGIALSGTINNGGLVKAGPGTITLSGSNTYGGATTLSSGHLQVANNAALGAGTVTLTSGTVSSSDTTGYTLANQLAVNGDVAMGDATNTGTLTFTGNVDLTSGTRTLSINSGVTFSGTINNGGLVKTGPGTLTLSSSNAYGGVTTINAGILKSAKDSTLSTTGTVTVNNAGSMLVVNYGGASDYSAAQVATLLGKTGFGSSSTAFGFDTTSASGTYGNVISMSAGLTKVGANTLVLTASNSFTGITTISSGTLQLGDGTSNNGSVSGNIANSAALVFANPLAQSYSWGISGTGTVAKTGTGTLTLSSSNSYSGSTTVTAGCLKLTNGGALGSGSASLNSTTGYFDLSNNITIPNNISINAGGGSQLTLNSTSGSNTWAGNVMIAGNRLGAAANAVLNLSGTISGPGFTNRSDPAGTVIISGTNNTYTGSTYIASGILSVSSIGNWNAVSTPGTLGAQTTQANGQVQIGIAGLQGTLVYTGTGETTNRQINLLGTTGGAVVDQSGTGLLKFTADLAATGVGNKTLTLQGSTAAAGEFAGAIIDSGTANTTSLAKAGTGTWTLSGNNTYSGSTTVSGGVLNFNNTTSLGSGAVIFSANATLQAGASGTIANSVTVNPSATGAFDTQANAVTLTGPVTGSGTLNKIGSGALVLTGSNTYTGMMIVNSGTLQIGDGASGSYPAGGSVTVNAGCSLGVNLSSNGVIGSNLYNYGGIINVLSGGTSTISGQIYGYATGILNQSGAGTAILTNNNDFFGTTAINAGVLQLSGTYCAYLSTINVGVNNGLTFGVNGTLLGGLSGSGAIVLLNGTNGVALTVGGNGRDTTYSGSISGASSSSSLTKTGTGTLTLTGSNNYVGPTTITSGTLQFGDGTSGKDGSVSTSALANNAAVVYNIFGNQTLSYAISGTGSLVKSGLGTLSLGATTYTGATSIVGGTLNLGNASALSGTGTVAFSGGVLQYSATNLLDLSARITGSISPISLDTNGQNVVYASAIGSLNSGGITKLGAGTLTFSGSNAYSGPTMLGGGTLMASKPSTLPGYNSPGTIIFHGGTLGVQIGGSGWATSDVDALLANATKTNGSLGIDTTNGNLNQWTAFATSNFGALGLTKSGSGMLTLNANNSYTGATTVSAGTLLAMNAAALPGYNSLGQVSFSGGTLSVQIGGSGWATSEVDTLLANATKTAGALGIDTTMGSLTQWTALTNSNLGALGLTVLGSGTFTLNQTNSYSGATVVGAGTLRLSSSGALGTSSSVNVTSGAVLDMAGGITVAGNSLTLNSATIAGLQSFSGVNTWAGNVFIGAGARIAADTGATLIVSGTISGLSGGGITVRNPDMSGLTILAGANTFDGPTTITVGVLSVSTLNSVNTASGLGTMHSSTSNLGASTTVARGVIGLGSFGNASSLVYTGVGETTDRQINLLSWTGGVTIDQSGTGLLKFLSDFSNLGAAGQDVRKTLTLQGSTLGAGEIAGSLVDSGTGTAGKLALSLIKAGTGTWILSGNNSYTGATTVNNGTLQIGNANALGTGSLTVNGGTFDLAGYNVSVPAFSGTGGNVTNSVSGTSTLTANISGTATYNGNIADGAGSVVLTNSGAGTLILGGSLTMTGLNASNGVTQLNQSGSIGAVNVAVGAILSMVAHSGSNRNVLNIASLTISGFTSTLANANNTAVNSAAYASVASTAQMSNSGVLTETGIVLKQAAATCGSAASPEAVPEPGTLGLLMAGAISLLRRRTGKKSFQGK